MRFHVKPPKAFYEQKDSPLRETDIAMLRLLLEDVSVLDRGERASFGGMLADLEGGCRNDLTKPQRDWVQGKLDELGLSLADPAERNKHVPRGAPVPTPAVLQHLPKKPPRRVVKGEV